MPKHETGYQDVAVQIGKSKSSSTKVPGAHDKPETQASQSQSNMGETSAAGGGLAMKKKPINKKKDPNAARIMLRKRFTFEPPVD
jgi:hypothetical protein